MSALDADVGPADMGRHVRLSHVRLRHPLGCTGFGSSSKSSGGAMRGGGGSEGARSAAWEKPLLLARSRILEARGEARGAVGSFAALRGRKTGR